MKLSNGGIDKIRIAKGMDSGWVHPNIEKAEKVVSNWVIITLDQDEFDELVMLVIKIGVDKFKRSTLLKKLNKGDKEGVRNELSKWQAYSGTGIGVG